MHESDPISATPLVSPADRASDHLGALARRWWLILGCAILAGAGAYGLSKQQQPRYEATAKVLLTSVEPVNLLSHSTAAPSLDPERNLNTDIALVKLDSVARKVQRELHVPLTRVQLLGEVSVSAEGLSNLVAISVSDLSPARAAAIANAFAARYIDVRRAQAQAAYRTAAELAQRRLAQLDAGQLAGQRGPALRRQLMRQQQQLLTTGELQTGGAQLVDRAQVPTTAASPRPRFSAIVGAIVGAMIGALAALVAGITDRRRDRLGALAATNGHTTDAPPKPTVTAPERPVPSHRGPSGLRD
jgi:polysaccharide biosynthesis transport protein